jgi:hypothetical protein
VAYISPLCTLEPSVAGHLGTFERSPKKYLTEAIHPYTIWLDTQRDTILVVFFARTERIRWSKSDDLTWLPDCSTILLVG